MAAASLMSRRDLTFLLYEWLDVVKLTDHEYFTEHSRDTFDAVLDLSADLAAEYFAPHNKTADQHAPSMRADGTVVLIDAIKQALDAYNRAGLTASSFRESLGACSFRQS